MSTSWLLPVFGVLRVQSATKTSQTRTRWPSQPSSVNARASSPSLLRVLRSCATSWTGQHGLVTTMGWITVLTIFKEEGHA